MTHLPNELVNKIIMMSRPTPNPVIQSLNYLIKSYELFKRMRIVDGFLEMVLLYDGEFSI